MATFEYIANYDEVKFMVERGATHYEVAMLYQSLYPMQRGLSARSVRRYCSVKNITRLTDDAIEEIVGDFILNYGHTYGRRMMQGSIRAHMGVTSNVVSQRRVARALMNIAPNAYQARARDLIDRTNPIPYYAPYFGYKCHFDQNEKIGQDYGCTHVLMIDGCSRLVTGYASMPIKNPILIYEFVFRPAICKYGIWEQLRMDHGREFFLVIFAQKVLSHYRLNERREAFKQTTSTENNVAERFWPEVNSRVNYPLKRAMGVLFQNSNEFDLGDPVVKYCVSWITLYACSDAVEHFVSSWNHHRVPGPNGCIPIENMRQTKNTAQVEEQLIPTTPELVHMYESNGGRLTRNSSFGVDPLLHRQDLYESRDVLFKSNAPTPREIFSEVVHGSTQLLMRSFKLFYNLTINL